MDISSEQIRAARALIRWEQKDLAEASKLSLGSIKRLESLPGSLAAQARTIEAIQDAFAAAGVEFTNGGQPGVRMRKEPAAKPPISDEAAIGDDPESRGDPYRGSAK